MKKQLNFTVFLFSCLSLFFMQAQSQSRVKVAHGGPAGIYFVTPFAPCSTGNPNKNGAVKIKVERRVAGESSWNSIGFFKSPESKKELSENYDTYFRFALAPEFTNSGNLEKVWEKFKSFPVWDSIQYALYDRILGLAIGNEFLDTTAVPKTLYEYQVSEQVADGSTINSKITNAVSAPDESVFDGPAKAGLIEQSLIEIHIEWKIKSEKRIRMFKVYRKHGPLEDFKFIANETDISLNGKGDSAVLNMRDRSVVANQLYYYYVVAYDGFGNFSMNSDTLFTKTYEINDVLLPQFFIAKNVNGSKAIELSWKLVSDQNISSIEIFRCMDYEGQYERIGMTSGEDTSFIDYSIDPALVYYYYIQSTDNFQHKTRRSARTYGLMEDLNPPAPPRYLYAEMKNEKAALTWTTSEANISGYFVFRSNGLDTNYLMISDFIPHKDSSTTFIDERINFRSPYGYSYVVVQENTSHVQSRYSLPAYVSIKMQADSLSSVFKPTVQAVNGKAMLFWNSLESVSGITSYNILRRKKGEPNFAQINKTILSSSVNYYLDSTVQNGNVYEYSVVAEVYSGGKTQISESVEFDLSYPAPSPPNGLELYKTPDGVLISWSPENITPLKEFEVYRNERGEEKAEKISSVPISENSFIDTKVISGKSYFYFLVAVGSNDLKSDDSESKFIRIK